MYSWSRGELIVHCTLARGWGWRRRASGVHPKFISKKGHSLFGHENACTSTHRMPFAFFFPRNALLWLENVIFTILISNKLCIQAVCFSNKEVVSLRGLLLLRYGRKRNDTSKRGIFDVEDIHHQRCASDAGLWFGGHLRVWDKIFHPSSQQQHRAFWTGLPVSAY